MALVVSALVVVVNFSAAAETVSDAAVAALAFESESISDDAPAAFSWQSIPLESLRLRRLLSWQCIAGLPLDSLACTTPQYDC